MATDPVCGMYVREDSPMRIDRDGVSYYFCSRDCMEKFSEPEEQVRKLKKRLAVGIIFSIPVLVVNYLIYPSIIRDYLLIILAGPVQFYSGSVFYSGSFHSLRARSPNMDVLIALGSSVAYFFSVAVTIARNPLIPPSEVYFDASSVIITLILVGQYSESVSKMKAQITARGLLDLIPRRVHRVMDNGQYEDIPVEDAVPGDFLAVYPGEYIPCDGIVVTGQSEVNESIVTGEQRTLLKVPGSMVASGTVNLNGTLKVRIKAIGRGSSLDEINELITRASMGRTSFQRIADRFSSVFVPSIMGAALASSLFWLFYLIISGIHDLFIVPVLAFVSVVVIACPCSIGLATPISLLVSSDTALSRGIIIRNPSSMERLSKINYVLLDKTGTVTSEMPSFQKLESTGISHDELLGIIYSLETNSIHPISKAINEECRRRGIKPMSAVNVQETPGIGIEGDVEGMHIKIRRGDESSGSTFSVYRDGLKIGDVSLRYALKPNVRDAVTELMNNGISVGMVSGDSMEEVKRIAAEAGIKEYWFRKMPEQKVKIVTDLQESGKFVLFLGDGINDAAAIATADVGAAVGSGTDIARSKGDLIFNSEGIESVYASKIIATETVRKIRQNIIYAIAYNVALVPVAAGILVPIFGFGMFAFLPFLSAVAMGFSSTSVVLNSLRLRKRLLVSTGKIYNRNQVSS